MIIEKEDDSITIKKGFSIPNDIEIGLNKLKKSKYKKKKYVSDGEELKKAKITLDGKHIIVSHSGSSKSTYVLSDFSLPEEIIRINKNTGKEMQKIERMEETDLKAIYYTQIVNYVFDSVQQIKAKSVEDKFDLGLISEKEMQIEILRRIKGIGKKTAEKLLKKFKYNFDKILGAAEGSLTSVSKNFEKEIVVRTINESREKHLFKRLILAIKQMEDVDKILFFKYVSRDTYVPNFAFLFLLNKQPHVLIGKKGNVEFVEEGSISEQQEPEEVEEFW